MRARDSENFWSGRVVSVSEKESVFGSLEEWIAGSYGGWRGWETRIIVVGSFVPGGCYGDF